MSSAPNRPVPLERRYDSFAVALHWLLALVLLGMFACGLYMVNMPISPLRLKLINWHKWTGMTFLAISTVRLAWRLINPPPPLDGRIRDAMAKWQLIASQSVHYALYILFFVVPLAGWAYSSASGFQVVLFGRFPVPDILSADQALADVLKHWHAYVAFSLLGLVVLHILAALKHQWIDRDGLLHRMLPALRKAAS